jgi:hypothetical protein
VRRWIVLVLAATSVACTAILGLRDNYTLDGGADSSVEASGDVDVGDAGPFVQSSFAIGDGSSPGVTVPLQPPLQTGDFVVVAVGWQAQPATVNVDDDKSGVYGAVSNAEQSGIVYQQLFYAVGTSGATKLIVSATPAVPFLDARVAVYRGLKTVDGYVAATGVFASVDASIDASAGAIIVAAGMANRNFLDAAGGGFTVRELTPIFNILEDRVVVKAGVYTPSATLDEAGSVVFQVAGFK